MNETIEIKMQKLIQDITSIINTKYKEQYTPKVEEEIDKEIAELLKYFKNMPNINTVKNYLEIAKLNMKISVQKLFLTRKEILIQEAISGINISRNGLTEELTFNDKKINLQSCLTAIELMINEKISEVEAKIINDLYKERYSGVYINNFSLGMDTEKNKSIRHLTKNIKENINSLDRELITEIDKKCKNEDKDKKEKMENLESKNRKIEIEKPKEESEKEKLKIIFSQINPQDRIDMIRKIAQQKESEDLER